MEEALVQISSIEIVAAKDYTHCHRHGGVEVVRLPIMREIGVRSPVATGLCRKNRQWQLHC